MHDAVWLRRLSDDGSGWYFWKADGLPEPWRAVIAPKGYRPPDGTEPNPQAAGYITANTPVELRKLVRQRYSWYDHCQTCGTLARECGHRQPERRDTSG